MSVRMAIGILLALLGVVGVVLMFRYGYIFNPDADLPEIVINNVEIPVEVVTEGPEMVLGLSGRKYLPNDQGMLFVFDRASKRSFWMKDMLISIDIIWIDSDYNVVDITHNATPDSYPEKFTPNEPAMYVLEVNSGFAGYRNISIGDKATLSDIFSVE